MSIKSQYVTIEELITKIKVYNNDEKGLELVK